MNTINATYTIPWCRDWLPVTKIFYINWTGKACYFYSDGLTNIDWTPDDTGWTEGSCDSVPTPQTEPKWGSLWVIAWELINNTWLWTLFDWAPSVADTSSLANIQSISITGMGIIDAWDSWYSDSQILIEYPDWSRKPMFDWQTLSFSVVKPWDTNLLQTYIFTASWNAYASIDYTSY